VVFRVGPAENRMVFVGVAAEVVIQWGILLLFAPAILLLDESRKSLIRRFR
jgi:hypothetical protein